VHHLPEDAEVRDLRAERVRHFLDAGRVNGIELCQ
jgi:hypothetical protein